jgi:beta-lactamase regulating signal transducer with metallopeptidase domain
MIFDGVIERLNLWGDQVARIAWPLFWQSNLLIAAMFILDLVLRRRVRPAVRHALWLVVLVKLLIPPSFAIPTGIGWWLRPREIGLAQKEAATYVVTYGPARATMPLPAPNHTVVPTPRIHLSTGGWGVLLAGGISLALLIVMVARWRRLRYQLRKSQTAPAWMEELLRDIQGKARCHRPVKLLQTDASISPALCGLFRQVIVLPTALVKQLTPPQLRAVLLHELYHLRNGDVWINCFQSLLQIAFWWHPLLWLANARIRRIREEVVDDAVRLALGEDAENYAPTLLEVARLALGRPLATLGLVGILESPHALKQRIDRLVNFPAPRRVGLSIISGLAILAFASVALPMGQAPPKIVRSAQSVTPSYRAADIQWSTPILYYTYDKSFLDYFGVDTVEQTLAQINSASNESQRSADPSKEPSDQANLSIKNNPMIEDRSSVKITHPALGLQPLTENGWVEYNLASGIATATNGVVLTYGDTTLSADSITLNNESGEIFAEGSVKLKKVADIPLGGKFHGNITNQLFAQNQSSVIGSSRIPQAVSGRRRIMSKLEEIRLNHVAFDNLPLSEVVNYLRDEAKKRDPEGKGINFMINPNADLGGPGTIDPATGLPTPTAQAELADINSVAIRIVPPLEDVRMIDVLDAITKVADKRIRYSIEDYAVSFRLAGNEPTPLFSRTIKVDPTVFAQGLESVVGISVGNFQTGGQGGGGQQGNSSVTVPRVQVAPNGIGGQGAQGAGQGGISGVTRPTTSVPSQTFRQFLANAGVDLTPPKSAFYNDRAGTLLVHGTLNDLAIVEKAIGEVSAGSAQSTTAIKSENPPAPISPQTDETKAPVLGDLPVGKALTRTVEVVYAASPAGQNQIVNGKLLTRTIKLDVNNFFMAVQTEAHLSGQPSLKELLAAFRKLLQDAGVQLRAPETIAFDDRIGTLLVHTTSENMEAIEQIVAQLNYSPPQITIQARFVESSGDFDVKALAIDFVAQSVSNAPDGESNATSGDTNRSLIAILTEPQFRVVLHALEQRDGVDLITEQRVTTLSGRQAQVQTVDIQNIVKLNPQALVAPGVASSNMFVTQTLYSGPVLDIIPYVSGNDEIQLTVTATVTEFVGYDVPEQSEAVSVYLDGQATTTKPPHPRTHVRTMQTAATLHDGQTLVLGRPQDEMVTYDKEGKALSNPSTTKKNLYVFVTATLIDPKGNPIHNPGGTSAAPGHN